MISRIRKKLKNLYKTHTISKNIESIMLMLENKAGIAEIGVLLKLGDLAFKDLLEALKLSDKTFDYQYIHLKMMLEYQTEIKEIKRYLISKFSYSCVLMIASIFMNAFYLLKFNPMIETMMQEFGMVTSRVNLQVLVSYSALILCFLATFFGLFLYLFNRTLPQIFKLIVLKSNMYVKTLVTRLTLTQYKIAFSYFNNHTETIEAIKYVHRNQLLDLMATHIDANISDNNLVFQSNDSWMIDPYLSMATLGLETIDISKLIDSYAKLSKKREISALNKYSSILKFIAIILVGIVIYVFYTSLMMPLSIMEVL